MARAGVLGLVVGVLVVAVGVLRVLRRSLGTVPVRVRGEVEVDLLGHGDGHGRGDGLGCAGRREALEGGLGIDVHVARVV